MPQFSLVLSGYDPTLTLSHSLSLSHFLSLSPDHFRSLLSNCIGFTHKWMLFPFACRLQQIHSTLAHTHTHRRLFFVTVERTEPYRAEEHRSDQSCDSVKNLLAARAVRFARAAEDFESTEEKQDRQADSQSGRRFVSPLPRLCSKKLYL